MLEIKTVAQLIELCSSEPLVEYIINANEQLALDQDNAEAEDLQNYFGGNVFLIQKTVDLKEIPLVSTLHDEHDTRTILDTPDSFDMCREILDGAFIEIMLMTNNGGGHTYYVPKSVADGTPNVRASVVLTREAWEEKCY